MTKPKPTGSYAVMASRVEAPDSLDLFPTPPFATRALLEHVIGNAAGTCWEPAAGLGHMSRVLAERFGVVHATDVFPYGEHLTAVGSFVGVGPDVINSPTVAPDWIITNPPFNLAVAFVERALQEARIGVAMLVRTAWLEGMDRYERLFSVTPPAIVAPFVERVAMVKGRWDPAASTATSYAWIVWRRPRLLSPWEGDTRLVWIPPGCKDRLTKPDDVRKFTCVPEPADEPCLFEMT